MTLVLLALLGMAEADEPDDESPDATAADAPDDDAAIITVLGDDPRGVDVPGSAQVVTSEDLEQLQPLSGNEVLQQVTGLTVTDEEGLGLRLNVGMRGLEPTRSRKVLVLEDGAPVSLAPYGEPEMYYAPVIERVDRVEVVKGAGSILFGPRTIGGVIHYITPDPPKDPTFSGHVRGGTWGHQQLMLGYGDTQGQVGYQLTGFHQRFDGARNLDLRRTDLTAKVRLALKPGHTLVLKGGFYQERSQSTYLGLTTPQFQADPNVSYATNDEFLVQRAALSVLYAGQLAQRTQLQVLAYSHLVHRDWWRQDYDRSNQGFDYERVVDGQGQVVDVAAASGDGSSIFFRDTTTLRGRDFAVGGVEARLKHGFALGATSHQLQVGARVHLEGTHEQRVVAQGAQARSGDVLRDNQREGRAFAAWALHRVGLAGDRVLISPGVRSEIFGSTNTILRADGEGAPVDLSPPKKANALHTALIPGVGVTARLTGGLSAFGGSHRGWAPPRVKDAITTDGDTLELSAENSWNHELGLRLSKGDVLHAELAGFYLDFANQIVPPAEANGDDDGAGLVNGGETTHVGVEASVHADPLGLAGYSVRLPLFANYTYARSRFGPGWGTAIEGQRLPYAPEHQVAAGAGVVLPQGVRAQLTGNWLSFQSTDRVDTVEASLDGVNGRLPARLVLDAQVTYTHQPTGLSGMIAVKNLADTVYITSRAPRGIQVGPRRHIYGGLSWRI